MSSSRAEKIRQPEILSTEGDVNASRRILKVNVSPGDVADVLGNTAARHTHGNKSQLDLITDGAHESKTNNPHQVTKAQVELGDVPNINFTDDVEKLIKQDQWLFSAGIIEGGEISEGTNTGTFKISAITKALLRTEANSIAPLVSVTLPEQDNQTIPNVDVVYYVIFSYGDPCTISLSVTSPNGFTQIPIGKVLKNTSNVVHYITGGYNFGDGIKKLHTRAMSLRALELRHGGMIAYSGTNNFTLSSGMAFGGINQYSLSAYDSINTQFTAIYNDGSGGWSEIKRNTIDYAHYDNLSGLLDTIKNNKYGIHYVFKHIDDQGVFTVYGTGSYSLAEAVLQATQLPDVPLHLSEFGVFVGAIVVPQTGGSFIKIISPTNQFFDSTPVSNHANLSNLDYSSSGHTGFARLIIVQTLIDKVNILWDMNLGTFAAVTLTGNRTLDNPINIIPGIYKLKVIQDATGGRTLDYGAYFKFPGGVKPVLSKNAGAVDFLEFTAYSSTELYLTNFTTNNIIRITE